MKRLFFILAVAASVVAACSITSCNKEEATTKGPLVGTWVNEATVGERLRKVEYIFTETNANTYTYFDGKMSGGNGGTYTYSAPNVTINFTQPTKTETGSLSGDNLTITTSDYGALVFKKQN